MPHVFKIIIWVITSSLCQSVYAQKIQSKDETHEQKKPEGKLTLLFYTRTISDAQGNMRFDQNILPNFKLNNILRMELGLRQGERPNQIGAYNHYKVELQTKSFFKTVRLIARMSDNVVRYGLPAYSRTNYLLIAESKYSISHRFEAVLNLGYVFSYQKSHVLQGEPILSGGNTNHTVYKVGLKYKLNSKGFLEGVIGTYDVFNPYLLTQPFVQISCDYELSKRSTLYSYFRYQYDKSPATPLNDFLGLGVKFALGKHA